MKKNIIFILLITLLTSCNLNGTNMQNTDTDKFHSDKIEQTSDEIIQEKDTNEKNLDEVEQKPEIITLYKNIIVKNPKMNEVTHEISEKLIGKYVAENDPDMYFQINPDGTAEISLNMLSGYAKYTADNIYITAFYDDNAIIIAFNIIYGSYTFPAGCGFSVSFKGDDGCTSFISTVYWSFYEMEFVKENSNELNGAAMENSDEFEQVPEIINQFANIVVKNPKINELTYEIDEQLIGKYIAENDPDMSFQINPDGTAEISLNTSRGFNKFKANEIWLTVIYSDYKTIITFHLVNGCTHNFGEYLAITFESLDNSYTSFNSRQISDSRIKYIKQY